MLSNFERKQNLHESKECTLSCYQQKQIKYVSLYEHMNNPLLAINLLSWDVFEIKWIRKFLKHIPLGLNCNYSPHSIALKQQRGVTKRLLDAVVSTLVLKQNMIICQEVILDLGRVRLGSIRDKNNWNNASKRLFGSYSHSGLSGFPFRLFCPQEQNSRNIFRNMFQNIFLFRNIPKERVLSKDRKSVV